MTGVLRHCVFEVGVRVEERAYELAEQIADHNLCFHYIREGPNIRSRTPRPKVPARSTRDIDMIREGADAWST
jgi:hypothetical protein